jgi:nitrate reductase NapE component
MLEPVPGQGGRRVGQIGGKILPAHIYHNEEERWHELLTCLVLFRSIAPPLSLGVVGTYPVHSVWFPNSLLLEGNRPFSEFWARTSGPRYLGY